ncbi:MAG: NADH-quinone oxidoreductase subunit J, partial [Actinomycetota bacterium]|nr:NADH-quinone oxidoreductase subunit J [Actinomycetota bacterium]
MDWVVFVVAAAACLSGALGVVLASHPVHSALMLVLTLFGVAVLFVAQQAHFIAAVQVIVYAGAIVVLFLFVIMLLGVDRSENVHAEPLRGQRPVAYLAGAGVVAAIFLLARTAWVSGADSVAGAADAPGSNVEKLADSLFTRYLLAFELTSVLLVIAVVGAVVLARHSPS